MNPAWPLSELPELQAQLYPASMVVPARSLVPTAAPVGQAGGAEGRLLLLYL
jgi:hypothetical protein